MSVDGGQTDRQTDRKTETKIPTNIVCGGKKIVL